MVAIETAVLGRRYLLFDGLEIQNNHLGCIKPVVNNGINYLSLNWR